MKSGDHLFVSMDNGHTWLPATLIEPYEKSRGTWWGLVGDDQRQQVIYPHIDIILSAEEYTKRLLTQ